MTDIFNDGILGEPTRGLEIRPPTSSRPSPSKGLKKLATNTPSTNDLSDLREQIAAYILKYGNDFAEALRGRIPDPDIDESVDSVLSLIHHHDQRIIAEAERRVRIDELKRSYPQMQKHHGFYGEGNYYYDDRLAALTAQQEGSAK